MNLNEERAQLGHALYTSVREQAGSFGEATAVLMMALYCFYATHQSEADIDTFMKKELDDFLKLAKERIKVEISCTGH